MKQLRTLLITLCLIQAVLAVPNCEQMHFWQFTKCARCSPGYVGLGVVSPFEACILENCSLMDTEQTDKCSSCNSDFIGVGTAPYSACTPDVPFVAPNCENMDESQTTKCATCSPGFVGAAEETAPFTSCIIENCASMDESETNKCTQCKTHYIGEGSAPYTACNQCFLMIHESRINPSNDPGSLFQRSS